MRRPLFSIIISTKNEEANISRLITSLHNQTYTPFEVIIVDNYSIDHTRQIAEKLNARVYVHGSERSKQRNYGAGQSQGKFLMFLDADMELPPHVVEECYLKLRKPGVHAVVLPETVPSMGYFSGIKRLEKLMYLNEPSIEAPRVFNKKSFTQVGGYDPKLIAAEDWDIANRIKKMGKISRIRTFIFHYETSLIRELKHKWYYAKQVHAYAHIHPLDFKLQSGDYRALIFLKKWNYFLKFPAAGIGLLVLKSVELILFHIAKLFPKL